MPLTPVPPVLAETTGGDVGLYALLVLGGGGAQWVITYLATRSDKNQERDEKLRKDRLQERQDEDARAIERQERYIRRLEDEIKRLKKEGRLTSRRCNKAVGWINHISGRLTEAKFNFDPWVEEEIDDDSGVEMHGPNSAEVSP